jgi:pimeloyl-ACP methyl ester carboxylesterase
MGRALRDPDGMAAFYATLNTTIDASGQRGSMVDMGYVDPQIPALIIWSERDAIIPVSHAHLAHAYLRRSRLELFPGTSHEPHRRHPDRFVAAVSSFMDGPSRRDI